MSTISRIVIVGLLSIVSLQAAEVDVAKLPPAAKKTVDFEKEIWPIFSESCIKCHGAEKQKGEYRMDTRAATLKAGDSGKPAVIPANSAQSPLVHMIAGLIEEGLMPPPDTKGKSKPLTPEQIGLVRAWIDQGAKWPEGEMKTFVQQIDFAKDVEPIFKKSCVECHGAAKQEGGFRIDQKESAFAGGKNYGKAIVARDSAKSPLMLIVSGKDEDIAMPEKHKLPEAEVEILKKWIDQGATWGAP